MNNDPLNEALDRDPALSRPVDPALLGRIAQSIGESLQPVRPMPPTWALVSGLMLIGIAVATGGAWHLGLAGLHKMSAADVAVIFPALGLLLWAAAARYTSEMIPGSRVPGSWWVLPAAVIVVLVAAFGVMFQDYATELFVHQGMVCLTAGLALAIPAGLASWWLLRRGFAVDSLTAGIARGTLAGLAGVGMLELHCANFEAPHVMLWHTAVVPVSGAACWLLVRGARWMRANRQSRAA